MSHRWFAWGSGLGLAFWFMLGFPFGNHNESYYWTARFGQDLGWTILWDQTLAANMRPLGQGLAYLGWLLGGGSLWPVQALNFLLAVVALRIGAAAVDETRTFAVAAAVTTGGFFAGYLYLFHLHGVFYSPVLLLMAGLLTWRRSTWTLRRLDVTALLCSAATALLFHPYALIVYSGFAVGLGLEQWKRMSAADLIRRIVCVLTAGGILLAMRPGHQSFVADNVRAFVTSYSLTEVVSILVPLAVVLTMLTAVGIDVRGRVAPFWNAALALGLALGFVAVGLPVTLLWVLVSVLKAASRREWTLCGITASAAVLPGIAASGSPTYAVFAVFASTIVMVTGAGAAEAALRRVGWRWLLLPVTAAAVLALAVRMGVSVPIVSRGALPLMAEREKSWQLEAVVEWVRQSEYRGWQLTLEHSVNPVDAGNDVVDRSGRPPTYQNYLDSYMASVAGTVPDGDKRLVVTFGNRPKDGLTLIKTVPGRFAGDARVFKASSE